MAGKKIKDCDCLSVVLQNIIDKTVAENINVKGYKIFPDQCRYVNKSWYPVSRLYAPVKITSAKNKVNGELSEPKKHEVNLFFTYCPFCGTKYPDQETI